MVQEKISVDVEGMTCQACATRIEKVLNKKDFIQEAGVNFASEEAQITFDNTKASPNDILNLIKKTGYKASLKKPEEQPKIHESRISWRLWLLLAINIPFWIGMVGMMVGKHEWMMPSIWQFVLASIVQLWLAIPFYKSAWASIKGGLANMDVLVTIGTVAIYAYSVYMLFFSPHRQHEGMVHVYFEASVMVIGFVSLGKFLEDRAKKNSLNSLGLLLKLTPQQVSVQRHQQWVTTPIDQVVIGDILRANHGERIAADGIVQSGEGWADESHLTGESNPEQKMVGSKVLAGSVMSEGSIIYQAEQLGSKTLLGDMMQALSEAQGSKAPIARIADKVSGIFVPVVVGIAILTFVITWGVKADWVTALMNAVAVLVIACPCALGLATPAAIMVGMGKAVKQGIWFKDATVMEEAAHVNAVVLDKTGTLTEGKPKVAAIWRLPDSTVTEDDLLRIVAAVEQNATHPLAKAIVDLATEKNLSILATHEAKTIVGEGIVATVEGGGEVKVGKPSFTQVVLPADLPRVWQIASVVTVAINGKPVGAFAMADSLKEDTAKAIKRLQENAIDVYVMSGDHQQVVEYIAHELGIQHAMGNMSPRDKATQIQQLKANGKIVAMVGDGVNDAPALAAANVSFAMKGGADVAEHTASATLMQKSVNQMVDALLISRATLKNIKQNLFFAFIYNVLGIPLAALGFLNPIIAGAAMAMSSVSVLGNALRLKGIKIK
ncbi:cation-translocating P-type ATPase [Pelistega sp. MC2]|uniref:heavy metal translocating P-type ATPase n=1 Tax=Pelistega sp. MC2 TaxID=1720297 RepID=UPI001C409CB4|nr:heavy metal translocating P-type ATPase [Pelistega sp. MC2]